MNDVPAADHSFSIRLFTIGFTEKPAREFFEILKRSGVKRVIDVRLSNTSQLAGFTKKGDFEFFLRAIADIDYAAEPDLAPTKEILNDYKKKQIDWNEYESRYRTLLDERRPAERLDPKDFDNACLLCSEPSAERCHRRLAAEYLKQVWKNVSIEHL
jgi:uncharacterized protein (DUF488 family)